jgi:hypothetical protein
VYNTTATTATATTIPTIIKYFLLFIGFSPEAFFVQAPVMGIAYITTFVGPAEDVIWMTFSLSPA